jgi:thiamine transporter ThiT
MTRLPLAFFSTAALCVVGGMIWGIIMAASGDHSMMPAHAHLNLMGWATLALMGTFYAITGKEDRLGWVNYALSTLGVVVSIPSLAMLLAGNQAAEKGATAGAILALLGMLVFTFEVLTTWRNGKIV